MFSPSPWPAAAIFSALSDTIEGNWEASSSSLWGACATNSLWCIAHWLLVLSAFSSAPYLWVIRTDFRPWISSTAAFLLHWWPLTRVKRNPLFRQLMGSFSSLFCLCKEIYRGGGCYTSKSMISFNKHIVSRPRWRHVTVYSNPMCCLGIKMCV